MFYGFLADGLSLIHFAYVSFVVIGLVLILIGIPLGWGWIRDLRFRLLHLAMISIVALESMGGLMCPLTTWENKLRILAGQPEGGDSFVANLLNKIMFFDDADEGEWLGNDHWVFKSAYVSFAALVVMTFFLAPPYWRQHAPPSTKPRRGCTATVLFATASFILLYTALCMENYKTSWDLKRAAQHQEALAKQNDSVAVVAPAKEERIPVYVLAMAGAVCAVLGVHPRLKSAPKSACLLLATCLATLTPIAADSRGQTPAIFQELHSGVEHARLTRNEGPVSIHVVRVARTREGRRWTTASGQDRVLSLGTVPAMAQTVAERHGVKALAAINGDWFEIAKAKYQGDPRGLHIVEGEVVSAPTAFTSFWVDARGNLNMGGVESKFRVVWSDGKAETPFGLNEFRADERAVLYTPALVHHAGDRVAKEHTTRTSLGRELVLEPVNESAWPPARVGGVYPAKITAIRDGGAAPLGPRSVVLSLGPKLLQSVPAVAVGDVVTLRLETAPDVSAAVTAIAGGPRLVKTGASDSLDHLGKDRHPRSLLGWNNEHVFLAVIDGRQPKLSIGMSYQEMALLAVELRCQEAMALDGGGSSTLWAGGRVLNSPSDGAPRRVANALILVEEPAGRKP